MRTFRSGRYLADLMAELDRAAISLRIAEARDKRAGLTQPELAELLSVHWRTIQDWESPKNANVPWDRLGEIAEATGVTKEWILHGHELQTAAATDQLAELREDIAGVRRSVDALREDVRELGGLKREVEALRALLGSHPAVAAEDRPLVPRPGEGRDVPR